MFVNEFKSCLAVSRIILQITCDCYQIRSLVIALTSICTVRNRFRIVSWLGDNLQGKEVRAREWMGGVDGANVKRISLIFHTVYYYINIKERPIIHPSRFSVFPQFSVTTNVPMPSMYRVRSRHVVTLILKNIDFIQIHMKKIKCTVLVHKKHAKDIVKSSVYI